VLCGFYFLRSLLAKSSMISSHTGTHRPLVRIKRIFHISAIHHKSCSITLTRKPKVITGTLAERPRHVFEGVPTSRLGRICEVAACMGSGSCLPLAPWRVRVRVMCGLILAGIAANRVQARCVCVCGVCECVCVVCEYVS
jgi:hypothetical protein